MWPQISLFISGVVSLALLPLITPLLYYLPKPALSIVVIFAVAKVRPLPVCHAVYRWPLLPVRCTLYT
jgi:MFS superfamily sulfate permease-like transporter